MNLYKASGNEKETMKKFWEQEKRRVIYVRDRFVQRESVGDEVE